jgi:hypothetical protein
MKFYQKIKLENLDKIQQEILDYYKKNPPRLEPDREVFLEIHESSIPITYEILNKRTRTEIVEMTACFVPPGIMTGAHVDGIRTKDDVSDEQNKWWIDCVKEKGITTRNVDDDHFYCNQWSFIIPIEHCEDSINCWYYNEDVTKENEKVSFNERPFWPYKFNVSMIKDTTNMRRQHSTVLDHPTIIKSNIYHNVDNTNNKNTRVVLVVRFVEWKDNMEAEDYFDCEDIKI